MFESCGRADAFYVSLKFVLMPMDMLNLLVFHIFFLVSKSPDKKQVETKQSIKTS